MDERDALQVLLQEEPKVLVVTRADPPAVLIVAEYASGGLTLPFTPTQARELAASLVEGAAQLERQERLN
jgi:hypothetical protein